MVFPSLTKYSDKKNILSKASYPAIEPVTVRNRGGDQLPIDHAVLNCDFKNKIVVITTARLEINLLSKLYVDVLQRTIDLYRASFALIEHLSRRIIILDTICIERKNRNNE